MAPCQIDGRSRQRPLTIACHRPQMFLFLWPVPQRPFTADSAAPPVALSFLPTPLISMASPQPNFGTTGTPGLARFCSATRALLSLSFCNRGGAAEASADCCPPLAAPPPLQQPNAFPFASPQRSHAAPATLFPPPKRPPLVPPSGQAACYSVTLIRSLLLIRGPN